jgi:hypothetical protein
MSPQFFPPRLPPSRSHPPLDFSFPPASPDGGANERARVCGECALSVLGPTAGPWAFGVIATRWFPTVTFLCCLAPVGGRLGEGEREWGRGSARERGRGKETWGRMVRSLAPSPSHSHGLRPKPNVQQRCRILARKRRNHAISVKTGILAQRIRVFGVPQIRRRRSSFLPPLSSSLTAKAASPQAPRFPADP